MLRHYNILYRISGIGQSTHLQIPYVVFKKKNHCSRVYICSYNLLLLLYSISRSAIGDKGYEHLTKHDLFLKIISQFISLQTILMQAY